MNKISCLKDGNSEVIQDVGEIGKAYMEYYQGIYDPVEMPDIILEGIENIHSRRVINHEVVVFLQSKVNDNEIIDARANILDDKLQEMMALPHIYSR